MGIKHLGKKLQKVIIYNFRISGIWWLIIMVMAITQIYFCLSIMISDIYNFDIFISKLYYYFTHNFDILRDNACTLSKQKN